MVADIRVVVTGATGRVAFPLLYQLAKGDVFGPQQPIILHILDIHSEREQLQGIAMELMNCAMEILKQVIPTTDPAEAFKDVDAAFLISARPRNVDMERRDQLSLNICIFKAHGEALNLFAKKSVKVLVIGDPVITNVLICSRYAPSIPVSNFTSLSRLRENRAKGLLAAHLKITTNRIHNIIIWGNCSKTNYPDVRHSTVDYPDQLRKEINAYEAVKDDKWLKTEYIQRLDKRAKAKINNQPVSFSISGAHAAVEHMRYLWYGTPPQTWISMGVISDGSYGVPPGLFFSFPVFIKNRTWRIVKGLHMDSFAESRLKIAIAELLDEKEEAMLLCNLTWNPPFEPVPYCLVDTLFSELVDKTIEMVNIKLAAKSKSGKEHIVKRI